MMARLAGRWPGRPPAFRVAAVRPGPWRARRVAALRQAQGPVAVGRAALRQAQGPAARPPAATLRQAQGRILRPARGRTFRRAQGRTAGAWAMTGIRITTTRARVREIITTSPRTGRRR